MNELFLLLAILMLGILIVLIWRRFHRKPIKPRTLEEVQDEMEHDLEKQMAEIGRAMLPALREAADNIEKILREQDKK